MIRTRLQVERDQVSELRYNLTPRKDMLGESHYKWLSNLAGEVLITSNNNKPKGCYTGFVSSTIGYLPSHAIYFLSYNWSKDVLQKFHDKHIKTSSVEGKQSMWVSFVAGGFADLAATFFVVPMEVVVQRLQIQDPHSKTKYKGGIGNLSEL